MGEHDLDEAGEPADGDIREWVGPGRRSISQSVAHTRSPGAVVGLLLLIPRSLKPHSARSVSSWQSKLVLPRHRCAPVLPDVDSGPDCEEQPKDEEGQPEACAPRIGVEVRPRKAPKRISTITTIAITALIPSSRDHGTRPLFIEKAAASQYSQNATHRRRRRTRLHASRLKLPQRVAARDPNSRTGRDPRGLWTQPFRCWIPGPEHAYRQSRIADRSICAHRRLTAVRTYQRVRRAS